MNTKPFFNNLIKYLIGFVTVLIFRLVPHPPNVEGIMSTMMPYAKRWGVFSGIIFSSISILLFDLITGTIGLWTLFTGGTYGLIGLAAGIFFRNRKNSISSYLTFSIPATIFYDAVTGIGAGVLLFKIPLAQAFIGQIPFTAYHLAGNIVLGVVLSPLLYRWVVDNPKLKTYHIIDKLTVKA